MRVDKNLMCRAVPMPCTTPAVRIEHAQREHIVAVVHDPRGKREADIDLRCACGNSEGKRNVLLDVGGSESTGKGRMKGVHLKLSSMSVGQGLLRRSSSPLALQDAPHSITHPRSDSPILA